MNSPEPCSPPSVLPYTDTKPQGAADFFFAINATFRFVISKFGTEGWVEYLRDMAREYYRPVWHAWKVGGLDAVARYLVQSFEAEPDAVFAVRRDKKSVVLDVVECPAIKHLRKDGRIIVPEFCQHCYFQYSEMARLAGFHMRLEGGNGACRQTFSSEALPPQDMKLIADAK
jgi:hypothetical protein